MGIFTGNGSSLGTILQIMDLCLSFLLVFSKSDKASMIREVLIATGFLFAWEVPGANLRL